MNMKTSVLPEDGQERRLKHVRAITNKNTMQKVGVKYYIYYSISFIKAMTELRDVCLYLIEKLAFQIWNIELTLNFV
jgi:hypothetical protein